MTKLIGLIVDGPGDFASFNRRFKTGFKILKTDGPRGHCAKIHEIVARSKKQIRMLKAFRCQFVIVVLDFECRDIEYGLFLHNVNQRFSELDFGLPVFVASPNTMIENWYLADIAYLSTLKKYLKDKVKQKRYEGTDGKRVLKKVFKKKYKYNEVMHGPELFELIRFEIARRNSTSLAYFLGLINENLQEELSF